MVGVSVWTVLQDVCRMSLEEDLNLTFANRVSECGSIGRMGRGRSPTMSPEAVPDGLALVCCSVVAHPMRRA
jgi:hypothetical protein